MAKDDIYRSYAGTKVWPMVHIKIQEPNEAGYDKLLAIPDEDTIIHVPIEQVFLLKGAMSSGKPSVTFYAKAKDGLHIAMEISPNLLNGIVSAIKGVSP